MHIRSVPVKIRVRVLDLYSTEAGQQWFGIVASLLGWLTGGSLVAFSIIAREPIWGRATRRCVHTSQPRLTSERAFDTQ